MFVDASDGDDDESPSMLCGPTTVPLDAYVTAGALAKPSIADNGDGSVTVGTGTYVLYPSTTMPHPQLFTLPGGTFVLTDLVNNYIQLSYGTGTPVLLSSTDRSAIDQITVIPVYTIYRNGTVLSIIDFDTQSTALANKLSDRLARTERFSTEIGGLAIGETGTRNITITSGAVWIAAVRLLLSSYNSGADNAVFYFHAAGIWNKSTVTQYNNAQYDDGTDLQNLLPLRYAVNWVYRSAGAGGNKAYYVLGGGNYTLAEAQNSTVPLGLPPEIVALGVLVGRIIVVRLGATATQIDSAFTQTFAGGGGSAGSIGPIGPPGFALDGEDGEDGVSVQGPRGFQGAQGVPGVGFDGLDGEDGFPIPGTPGTTGASGPAGMSGPAGPAIFLAADDGEDGAMGPPGPAGTGSSPFPYWVLPFAAAHG